MPITIVQGFDKLKQNLEITDLQVSTVSTRQQNVRDAVESEMTVLDSFLTGSYRRNTMIAPLSEADADVFIILHPDYYEQNGQASLLDKIKRILRKTYTKTPEISRNGQAVTITFTDFQVDVVPAFYRDGGGFLIPDSILQRWIATDPKIHVEIWSKSNNDHNGDIVPLIKMIKGWNKQHSGLLRSFHLETLILQILNNVTISDYPSGVRYVLDKARLQVQYAVIDPAGYGGNIGDYLDTATKIQDVVSRMETAYNRAVEAERLARENKTKEAYDKWRLIFGDYFPAYG
jgi:hypothetical protein